jgi:hypothetical protein
MSENDDPEAWRERRRAAADAHAEALARRQAGESAQARALLQDFVARARARGLPPEPLLVQGYGGRGTAKSQVRGWYLRLDRAVGVGEDGEFYVLTAPLTLLDRVRGIRIAPTEPPLVIGQGGRDGDTIDMVQAINRILPPDPAS